MESCSKCAWFCHDDHKCYKPDGSVPTEMWMPDVMVCRDWQFDGLKDWEREELDVLVAMEM